MVINKVAGWSKEETPANSRSRQSRGFSTLIGGLINWVAFSPLRQMRSWCFQTTFAGPFNCGKEGGNENFPAAIRILFLRSQVPALKTHCCLGVCMEMILSARGM